MHITTAYDIFKKTSGINVFIWKRQKTRGGQETAVQPGLFRARRVSPVGLRAGEVRQYFWTILPSALPPLLVNSPPFTHN